MSKPIPEEEYNKKPLTRLMKWAGGEIDPFLESMEIREQRDTRPDERLIRKHRRDRDAVIWLVHDQKHNKVYKRFRRFYKIASVLCCLALILMLLTAVSYLPPVGAADNPTSNEVSAKYIEDGLQDTGAVNIVTGMILDYRAFDTFGESNVLFIATCTVLILLRSDKKKDKRQEDAEQRREQHYEPKDDSILQRVTFLLFPVIVIFGIYVVLNGHLSPGGGFSGGAIIGAGLILYSAAFGFEQTERFLNRRTYRVITFCALCFYSVSKCYSFFTGANHLESIIHPGTLGNIFSAGLILPLNIAVGAVVACTMYGLYSLFQRGKLG